MTDTDQAAIPLQQLPDIVTAECKRILGEQLFGNIVLSVRVRAFESMAPELKIEVDGLRKIAEDEKKRADDLAVQLESKTKMDLQQIDEQVRAASENIVRALQREQAANEELSKINYQQRQQIEKLEAAAARRRKTTRR